MSEEYKLEFKRISLCVDVKKGQVENVEFRTFSGVRLLRNLDQIEKELFAVGAKKVRYNERTYKRIEDRAQSFPSGTIERRLTYKLKRFNL